MEVSNNKQLVIRNDYTQVLVGGNVNYNVLRDVTKQVKQNFYRQLIRYPKIGSGLTGVEWDLIKEVIYQELCGEDHALFQLPTIGNRSIAPDGQFA